MYDGTLLVVGFSLELFENEKNTYKQLLLNLPTEVELCGVIKFGDVFTVENGLNEFLQDVDITDNPLVIIVNDKKQMKAHFVVHDKFEEVEYDVLSSEEMWKQFVHVRLNTTLPLSCEATIAGVKNVMQNKRKKIASGQISFHINDTTVYLFGMAADIGVTGMSTESSINDLIESKNPEQHSKKKKYSSINVEVVPVNLVMKTTRDIFSEKLVKTAVKMMTTQRKPSFNISMPLKVDTLALVNRKTKLVDLYTVLVEAACRSLKLLESVLIEQLSQEGIGDGAGLRLPETYHFLPQELGHFFTRIIPKGLPDESMEEDRQNLHDQLALPTTRPMFRRGNAYPTDTGGKLLCPHLSIPPTIGESNDVIVSTVRGRYTYHHYTQDQFNDDGWGCAYRSMQTIFSWFRYQGYTTVDIPSHREIQTCLRDIGDKPTSFIGSKQWIGSLEVSFCLETLLGVHARIISVNSGADLKSYAQDVLINHFNTHGTPVMIGGGVLAHTILGVEYNTTTNEVRYLILDPHYTGGEDLTTVLNKGWCGWKSNDFWNKTAHYNMCLPLTLPAI